MQDENKTIEDITNNRKLKHKFPKDLVSIELEDSLFSACEKMFYRYVRHLVVKSESKDNDNVYHVQINGIINYNYIMRYIFDYFQIDKNLHQWLKSNNSDESLFKKSLISLRIGVFGSDLIHFVYLDHTIKDCIKLMIKNFLSSIPI